MRKPRNLFVCVSEEREILMKRGSGMEGREERSKGIEIRIADAFAIIKPTAPFKLAKHEALRKRNWSDSSGNSLAKADASR